MESDEIMKINVNLFQTIPANARHCSTADSLLVRWHNIKPAIGKGAKLLALAHQLNFASIQ